MSILEMTADVSIAGVKKFGLITGYFFSINIVVGAGFLALPNSFSTSGWLISLIFMIFMALQNYYLGMQLLEIMSRAEIISRMREEGIKVNRPTWKQIIFGISPQEILIANSPNYRPTISNRRFDISECVRILFGPKWSKFYILMLIPYLQGAQAGYATVFASSFASNVPLGSLGSCNIYDHSSYSDSCYANYWIYLMIYCVFMTYLTIRGLREQRWIQSLLTIMRFFIISLVVFTSIGLLAAEKKVDDSDHESFEMPPLATTKKLGNMASVILFTFLFQVQFPSISEFMKFRSRNLKKIIVLVTITSFALYALIGMIVPMAIHDVEGECTLSFREYSAGASQSDRGWWTYLIAYVIVLFPAIDVFSSFPLMGLPLSDNLMTLYYGVDSKNIPNNAHYYFRAVCLFFPFLIAFFVYDISLIYNWVGLFGFILQPIAIPIMHVAVRLMNDTPSNYDAPFPSKYLSLAIAGLNTVIMLFILISSILGI